MYYDFFGFREPPFSIAPDPRYLYLSDRHKEALAHLMYGVKGQGGGGFIVITGEVGTGKTTVSRCFIENAPDNVDIALILNPRLSVRELLSAICDELEISHDPGASIKQLVDLINQDLLTAHAAGRHKVLMIDEAQNLSAEVLEQLRLLTNLETAEKKLLQIVLLGQPELQQVLALPELRQLNQRVTARYHLDAIGKEELPAYLRYRLSVAGLRGDIFTPGAVRRLYRDSHGIPRLINLISDRALLGAYAEGEHEIRKAHIRQASREVKGGIGSAAQPTSPVPISRYLLLAASILVAVIGTIWLVYKPPGEGNILNNLADGPSQAAGTVNREPDNTAPSPVPFDMSQQSLTSEAAFAALLNVWGREYAPTDETKGCDFAREVGLACLDRQGTRRSLEFLDRPAILTLKGDEGQSGYVVIRSLEGNQARLTWPGGRTEEVSFSSLEPYWFGNYQVLWRLPDYMTDDGFYGTGTGEELWIGARMMELADRFAGSEKESARVKRLAPEEQVRWYQGVKGLAVDGIAGGMTVIQMNNDLNASVPRLMARKSGARG